MPSEPPVYCWFDFSKGWITVYQSIENLYSFAYAAKTNDLVLTIREWGKGERDNKEYAAPTISVPLELFSIVEDTS